jgi:hypothetical protein
VSVGGRSHVCPAATSSGAAGSGGIKKLASAISSGGVRFRLSPATCDVSAQRSGDCRSTDERGLWLFPLPGCYAVFPVPQDAPLWTYRESPELDRGRGLRAAPAMVRGARVEHPTPNLPRWQVAKGVLGYREAARREFPRSVAFSTQFSSIRVDKGDRRDHIQTAFQIAQAIRDPRRWRLAQSLSRNPRAYARFPQHAQRS